MATFEPALEQVLKWEGVYSKDPLDLGGETYKGISRKFHPNWPGWAILDGMADKNEKNEELDKLVQEFYLEAFWKAYAEGISDQDVAEKVFSLFVNMSPRSATKVIQRAVNAQGFNLCLDGIYGPNTRKAVELCKPAELVRDLRAASAEFRCKRVIENPSQIKFLFGWLRRDCE
jgi:lysozyme family protein